MTIAAAERHLEPIAAPIDGAKRAPTDRGRLVWRVSLCLFGVQLVGMLALSTVQYERFNLTNDFAGYLQAWTAIAHAHLNPYDSVFGVPFWRDDFELLMWPLAPLYWLEPHTITLLWLQDIVVVGGELAALAWAREALKGREKGQSSDAWLLALVAALLFLTPWSWYTIGFDFHFEAFTAAFALMAGREIWAGRYRRLAIWVPLTLFSAAAAGGLLVAGLGLAALTNGRKSRRVGVVVMASGIGWLALTGAIGAMRFGGGARGIDLGSMYGYLSNNRPQPFGYTDLLDGLVTHAMRAATMVRSHARYVVGYIASAGVIGLYSRLGWMIAAVVLLPSALNANPDFIHFAQAFQSWPAVLFLIVACGLVLQRLAADAGRPQRVVCVFGTLSLVFAVTVTGLFAGTISGYIERVSPERGTRARRRAAEYSSWCRGYCLSGRHRPFWGSGSGFLLLGLRFGRAIQGRWPSGGLYTCTGPGYRRGHS